MDQPVAGRSSQGSPCRREHFTTRRIFPDDGGPLVRGRASRIHSGRAAGSRFAEETLEFTAGDGVAIPSGFENRHYARLPTEIVRALFIEAARDRQRLGGRYAAPRGAGWGNRSTMASFCFANGSLKINICRT